MRVCCSQPCGPRSESRAGQGVTRAPWNLPARGRLGKVDDTEFRSMPFFVGWSAAAGVRGMTRQKNPPQGMLERVKRCKGWSGWEMSLAVSRVHRDASQLAIDVDQHAASSQLYARSESQLVVRDRVPSPDRSPEAAVQRGGEDPVFLVVVQGSGSGTTGINIMTCCRSILRQNSDAAAAGETVEAAATTMIRCARPQAMG